MDASACTQQPFIQRTYHRFTSACALPQRVTPAVHRLSQGVNAEVYLKEQPGAPGSKGYCVELQIHTTQSYDLKQGPLHKLYEMLRDPNERSETPQARPFKRGRSSLKLSMVIWVSYIASIHEVSK